MGKQLTLTRSVCGAWLSKQLSIDGRTLSAETDAVNTSKASAQGLERMSNVVGTARRSLAEQGFVEIFPPAWVTSGGEETLAPSAADFLAAAMAEVPRAYAVTRTRRPRDAKRQSNQLDEITYVQAWLAGDIKDARNVAQEVIERVHRDQGADFNPEIPTRPFGSQPPIALAWLSRPRPAEEPNQPDLRIDLDGALVSMDLVSRHAGELGSVSEVRVGTDTALEDYAPGYHATLTSLRQPIARFGLGIERLLMHLTNSADIAHGVPFAVIGRPPVVSRVMP